MATQHHGAEMHNLTKLFDLISDFHFYNENSNTSITTAANSVSLNATTALMVLPGKSLDLPLVMYDEFKWIVHYEFGLRVEDNEQVRLENHFTVNNSTHVFGARAWSKHNTRPKHSTATLQH